MTNMTTSTSGLISRARDRFYGRHRHFSPV